MRRWEANTLVKSLDDERGDQHIRKHHFPTEWDTWQLPPVHCEGYVNYPTALKIHDLQVFHVSEFSDNWKFYLVPLSTNQVLKVLTPHLIKQSLLNIIKYLMIHNHHYKQSDCCAKFLNRDVLRGYQVWQTWTSLFQKVQDYHHV